MLFRVAAARRDECQRPPIGGKRGLIVEGRIGGQRFESGSVGMCAVDVRGTVSIGGEQDPLAIVGERRIEIPAKARENRFRIAAVSVSDKDVGIQRRES